MSRPISARRWCIALTSLVLLVGGMQAPLAVAADSTDYPVADSKNLTGPDMIVGEVVGLPRGSSYSVYVAGIPKNSTLAAGVDGTEFNSPIIAYSENLFAGSIAKYYLRFDPSFDMTPYTNEDGSVNFDVTIVGANSRGKRTSSSVNTLTPADSPSPTVESSVAADGTEASVAVNVAPKRLQGAGASSTIASQRGASPSGSTATATATTSSNVAAVDMTSGTTANDNCWKFANRRIARGNATSPAWAIVGQSFSTTNNVKATSTYTNNASTTFGVSVSVGSGPWSATGGVSVVTASDSETGWSPRTGKGSFFYQSQFQGQRYSVYASYARGGVYCGEELRTISYFGGSRTVAVGNKSGATRCASQERGDHTLRNSSRAITWSNGFKYISPGLSVDASAQTGFTTKASLRYDWVRGGGYICGKGSGPGTSPVVGASPYSNGS